MKTYFKKLFNYEEYYKISNNGKVYSLDRLVNGCYNSKRKILGREIKTFIDSGGYSKITLYKNNKQKKCVYIHRLVIESFTGKIPDNMEVNHIDGDKQNNNIKNLEILTRQENFRHAVKNGLFRRSKKGTWEKI